MIRVIPSGIRIQYILNFPAHLIPAAFIRRFHIGSGGKYKLL